MRLVIILSLTLCLSACYTNTVTVAELREIEKTRQQGESYPYYNLGLKDGLIHVEAYGRIYRLQPEELPFAKKYPYSRRNLEFKQDLRDHIRPEYLRFFDLSPEKQ